MSKASPRPQVVFYMPSASPLLSGGARGLAGGAENQVVLLARALATRGHGVGIVAFADPTGLPDRVGDVDVISQRRPRVRLPVLRTLAFYAATVSILLASPARVLVQRAAGPHTILVALAARARRRRFVYASAGLFDFDFGAWERRRWLAWTFGVGVRLADEVVVQTGEQAVLCRERFGREPVLIKSIAEPAAPRAGRPEAFLWVGRLIDYKRPLEYVALARAVPEARFRMVAVGVPGPEGDRLAAEVQRAGRELPNLEVLAPRPRAELAPLMDTALGVVSTSVVEGMPNVFLEAWSRGVPALALNHDPDGVIEREGLGHFAGGSADRLSELARAMWRRRDDQDELGTRCRAYVAREHALERIVERWAQTLGLESG